MEEDTTEQCEDEYEEIDKQHEKTQHVSQLEVDQDQSGSQVSSQHSRFAQAPIPVLNNMVIDNIEEEPGEDEGDGDLKEPNLFLKR